jgi:hypothetical protein
MIGLKALQSYCTDTHGIYLNRTMIGLKVKWRPVDRHPVSCLNRTMIGLKENHFLVSEYDCQLESYDNRIEICVHDIE